jgi:opacity protein-like surface antigen
MTLNRVAASLLCLTLFLAFADIAMGADGGFYVAAGAGRSWQHVDPTEGVTFSTPGFVVRLRPSATNVDETNAEWNAGLGYRVNTYLAAEVSYLHFGSAAVTETYSLPPVALPLATFNRHYSSQIQGPALSVLGRLPLGRQITLFARGGVFFADEKITEGSDIGSNSITLGDRVWLAGAGAEWSLTPSWALRVEYSKSGQLDGEMIAGRTNVRNLALSAVYSW